ncbi:MAG: hypothetical protein ACKVJU_14910 [Verrucomicrobiales bacterium]
MSLIQSPFVVRVISLNGWWKTLISLAPFLIVLIGVSILTRLGSAGEIFVPLIFPLIGLGALITGGFVVHSIRRRWPKLQLPYIVLIFLAVAAAYAYVSFWICAGAILLNWMNP